MKREHHERKDRTAKRSDRRGQRQKGGVLHRERVPRSFALLKAWFSSAVPCPSAAMWSLQFSIFYSTNPKGEDGRGVCVCVQGEEFGTNLSDTGNTRNNRYTLTFHLFLYLFHFQSGRRKGNVSLFFSRSIRVEINHRPHLSTVLTARTSDYI